MYFTIMSNFILHLIEVDSLENLLSILIPRQLHKILINTVNYYTHILFIR